MTITPFNVYVWGFSSEELQAWPDDIHPHAVDGITWPSNAPVIVHGRLWPTFQELHDAGEIATDIDAVLFIPSTMEEPDESWAYFDEVLRANDEALWETVRDIADYPMQYQVEAWVSSVPEEMLDTMHRPNENLDYQSLPLPENILVLLRDRGYQEVFMEALNKRLLVRRSAAGFSEDVLEDYVRNRMNTETRKEVEAILKVSGFAQASLDVLYEMWTTPIAQASLAHNLNIEAQEKVLAQLVIGFAAIARIGVHGQHWRQKSAPPNETPDLSSLLNILRKRQRVLIEGAGYECMLEYDVQQDLIAFTNLIGAGSHV